MLVRSFTLDMTELSQSLIIFQKTLLRIDNFIQNQEEDGNLSVLLKGGRIILYI